MPTYYYKALDAKGAEVSGSVEARDKDAADAQIRASGVFITAMSDSPIVEAAMQWTKTPPNYERLAERLHERTPTPTPIAVHTMTEAEEIVKQLYAEADRLRKEYQQESAEAAAKLQEGAKHKLIPYVDVAIRLRRLESLEKQARTMEAAASLIQATPGIARAEALRMLCQFK